MQSYTAVSAPPYFPLHRSGEGRPLHPPCAQSGDASLAPAVSSCHHRPGPSHVSSEPRVSSRASRPLCSVTTAAAPRHPAADWLRAPVKARPNGSPAACWGLPTSPALTGRSTPACLRCGLASRPRGAVGKASGGSRASPGPLSLIVPASKVQPPGHGRSRSHGAETWQHRTPPTTSGAHLNGCGGGHRGLQRRFCTPGRWRLGESVCHQPSK
jgi:hypothetical protein